MKTLTQSILEDPVTKRALQNQWPLIWKLILQLLPVLLPIILGLMTRNRTRANIAPGNEMAGESYVPALAQAVNELES